MVAPLSRGNINKNDVHMYVKTKQYLQENKNKLTSHSNQIMKQLKKNYLNYCLNNAAIERKINELS